MPSTQLYSCVIEEAALIPDFAANGNLPAGIHKASWDELSNRFGHSEHRTKLLEGLAAALASLSAAGCRTVYINGSFVTRKQRPNDYDLCWSIDGVIAERLDPVLLDFSPEGRRAMKAKYLGDLFPAEIPEGASGKAFLEFFQTDRRTGGPKGIVAVDLGGAK
jgi:hypothetical protein